MQLEAIWQRLSQGLFAEEHIEQLSDEEDFEELGSRIVELDDELRVHAVSVLEKVKNPEVLATLVELYDDPLAEVRERALISTYRLGGDTMAEEEITARLLGDSVPAVRTAAALALGVTRTPTARVALEQALADEDPEVRQAVQQQLLR